jgi:hypothetical protein
MRDQTAKEKEKKTAVTTKMRPFPRTRWKLNYRTRSLTVVVLRAGTRGTAEGMALRAVEEAAAAAAAALQARGIEPMIRL